MTIAIAAPLTFRRRQPLASFLVIVALAAVYQIVESPSTSELSQVLPLALGLYAVSNFEDRRRSLLIAFLAVEALIVLIVGADVADVAGETTWVIATMAIGAVVRGRRERAQLAEQRRLDGARRMVDEERMRIARELHDIVAHSIATISVQAGMASYVFDEQPEVARQALGEIRQVSKDALRELRTTLGVLRADAGVDGTEPAPGFEQLGELVDRTEVAGVEVRLATSGAPRALSPATDLTAYRVVQEALTNVVRHAGAGSSVRISVEYHPASIEIVVSDSGPPEGQPPGTPEHGSQLGLIGMRERVKSVGGSLWTGNKAGGGFEVRAVLPTGETP